MDTFHPTLKLPDSPIIFYVENFNINKLVVRNLQSPWNGARVLEEAGFCFYPPMNPHSAVSSALLSEQHNKPVAALGNEVYFVQITPDEKTERLAEQISGWGIPINKMIESLILMNRKISLSEK